MSENENNDVTNYLVAKETHAKIKSYTDRGRLHSNLSDEVLISRYVAEMKKWAATPPPWEPLTVLNDIDAEASLRSLVIPYDDVAEAFEEISALMQEAIRHHVDDGTTPLDKDIDGYFEAKARPN